VRVHQLLGHTFGVADFWFVPEAAKLAGDPTARAIDLARVMAQVPLEFEPGARFSYSNTAYQAAARIIERRTAMSYDAYLAREFFTPLHMTSMHHCRGDASEMAGYAGAIAKGGCVRAACGSSRRYLVHAAGSFASGRRAMRSMAIPGA
jgi:CubicO group peptidase (beta-lactamase class C family)